MKTILNFSKWRVFLIISHFFGWLIQFLEKSVHETLIIHRNNNVLEVCWARQDWFSAVHFQKLYVARSFRLYTWISKLELNWLQIKETACKLDTGIFPTKLTVELHDDFNSLELKGKPARSEFSMNYISLASS